MKTVATVKSVKLAGGSGIYIQILTVVALAIYC